MPATTHRVEVELSKTLKAELDALAKREGRPLNDLVADALHQLIASKLSGQPRAAVMDTYQTSHTQFGPLYEKLAK